MAKDFIIRKIKMVRIGCPANLENYYCADEGWLILALHKAGCHPAYRDGEIVYFKKDKKLSKALKKLEIKED